VCQQLAGVVVNERPNIRRAAYDELKAILTNCIRRGPHTQNRAAHADFRAHLSGRIAQVRMIHAKHGAKLADLFARIAW
jgi:RNA-directed DNA polymerase